MKRIIAYLMVYTDRYHYHGGACTTPKKTNELLFTHEIRVQKCIRDGWQPFGPLQVHEEGQPSEYAIQVMVKYADDEQDD